MPLPFTVTGILTRNAVNIHHQRLVVTSWDILTHALALHGSKVTLFGLYTMLPLPILYGVWHAHGGSGEGRTLRSSRVMLLQQCGHYRWGGH